MKLKFNSVDFTDLEQAKEYCKNCLRDYAWDNNMLFREEQLIESTITGSITHDELYIAVCENRKQLGDIAAQIIKKIGENK